MWRLLGWLFAAGLGASTASAQASERCASQVERAVEAARDDARPARATRARRAIERCASRYPTDAAWVFFAARLLPSELDALAHPTATILADAQRVRALARDVASEDTDTTRRVALVDAWAALVLGSSDEVFVGLQDPDGVAFLRRASALRWRRGAGELAERDLRRAYRSMPQDVDVARELAALLVARGRPDEAVGFLAVARRGQPDSEALQREHALALLAAGRGTEALALLAGLAERDASGEDLVRHAEAALELGRPAVAEASARASLRLLKTEGLAHAHAIRGLALLALGRDEEARAALRLGVADVRARSALTALEGRPTE